MADLELPIYINGDIIPGNRACVSVFDRGFTRADGLFETLRAYNGRIFKLSEHLARLDKGLAALRYPVRSADLGLASATEDTLSATGLKDARIRIQITRGMGTTAFGAHADSPPTVVISTQPVSNISDHPLNVIIAKMRRDQLSPLAGIKTLNYLPSIIARFEAEDMGADEAILLNYAGFVAEGCASNVFLVHTGTLITPDISSGVLPGIIRQTILDIAREMGIPAIEKAVEPELLESADEIFLTSSSREVAPAGTLNGKLVGNGSHEMADLLESEYRKLVSNLK